MYRLLRKSIFYGSILFVVVYASAVSAEIKTGLYVKYLQVSQSSGTAFMQFSTADGGSAYTFGTGCQYNHSVNLNTQTADGKNMYVILMTAFIMRQTLEVNAGNCGANFPQLLEVAFGNYP